MSTPVGSSSLRGGGAAASPVTVSPRTPIEPKRGTTVSVSQILAALKQCSRSGDLETGKKLHSDAVVAGIHTNKFVATVLISMYCKCRSTALARGVFEGMVARDTFSWNSLIQGYVENGESKAALDLFACMDCESNSWTCVAALKACGNLASEYESERPFCLEQGIGIHKQAKKHGFDSHIVVATALVGMYSKCGRMQQAREVFDRMISKNVIAWSALILGYVESGESAAAIDLFEAMDCEPNNFTYVAALKACGALASQMEEEKWKHFYLNKGIAIHKQVKLHGLDSNKFVASSLVDMYSKCGSMPLARQVFDQSRFNDVVTWTSLIQGYVENGANAEALDLFYHMDCEPDAATYVIALKACAALACEKESNKEVWLDKGIALHKQFEERGLNFNILLASSLVIMYCKCGSMEQARKVFDSMVSKNVVTWAALILGYVENGQCLAALDVFTHMDCGPDSATYVAALKACRELASRNESEKQFCLEKGMVIYKQASEAGFDSHISVATSLVNMYCKCGCMELARQVFDRQLSKNVFIWNVLIMGYVENGESSIAMDLFACMDCEPNLFTYIAILKACGVLASEESKKQFWLQKGMGIHREARERGFDSEIGVATTLVDMYRKCSSMQRSREVFEGMVSKDVITWTSLIMGYAENGESQVAMDVFANMDREPNSLAYVAVLKACGSLAALRAGEQIHAAICKSGLEQDLLLANTLADFYGKCGSMSRAEELFNNVQSPDVAFWNVLISGYSFSGDPFKVFHVAKDMENAGLRMDAVTFNCVLTACNHASMVREGKRYFDSVVGHGLSLSVEHYNCMIDMLGRANRLEEALALTMAIDANEVTWSSLLGSCRKWKNLEVGKVAFDALVATGKADAAAYVVMSEIYESLSMRTDKEKIDPVGKNPVQAWMDPGRTWYYSDDGKAFEFTVGGTAEAEAVERLLQIFAGYRMW